MLKSIQADGKKYMPARGVIVYYQDNGFTMEVDGEEYGWYSDIREITPDIKELQEYRPM